MKVSGIDDHRKMRSSQWMTDNPARFCGPGPVERSDGSVVLSAKDFAGIIGPSTRKPGVFQHRRACITKTPPKRQKPNITRQAAPINPAERCPGRRVINHMLLYICPGDDGLPGAVREEQREVERDADGIFWR